MAKSATLQVMDRPKRWDVPFWEEARGTVRCVPMTAALVEKMLSVRPFRLMKESPRLRDLLMNDCRLRLFEDRELVVRQGDYGNSAFLILSGHMVVLREASRSDLGRRGKGPRSLWRSLTQRLTNPRVAEARDTSGYPQLEPPRPGAGSGGAGGAGELEAEGMTLLGGDVPVVRVSAEVMEREAAATLERPAMFGELAALGRLPRAASVASGGEAKLLEIRWQGLRDLRNLDEGFKQQIDENYRRFGLAATLEQSPLLSFLREPRHAEAARRIAAEAEFETYGRFDWHGSYQKLRQQRGDPIADEPVICRAGEVPNGLILIRAGFGRLSQPMGQSERTVSYLRKGDTYGLAELAKSHATGEPVSLDATLRAVGYVDVVRLPTRTVEELILPHLGNPTKPGLRLGEGPDSTASDSPDIASSAAESSAPSPSLRSGLGGGDSETPTRRDVPLSILKQGQGHDVTLNPAALNTHGTPEGGGGGGGGDSPGMLEFLVENRFINGTATMLIDLDRCTRCDECVHACASGHNNNPRFIRHGQTYGHHMVANACMHCEDPVCMIGCPTGAIHRTLASGEVVINDNTCIGCGVCADSCPYDNIRMTPIRQQEGWLGGALGSLGGGGGGALMIGPGTGQPIVKATKCDLCVEHHGGPACERACPHDALRRVNVGDLGELVRGLQS